MSRCFICLEQGGCCLRRPCQRSGCSIRVHWLCYLRWYFNENYRAACPCGCYINTYRFGLPPTFKTMEAMAQHRLGPTATPAPGIVEISPSNRWGCSCFPGWRAETQLQVSLFTYCTVFFLLAGYLGKLIVWELVGNFQVKFWTLTGFCFHFMGWIITCVILATVKVCLTETPESDLPVSSESTEDADIIVPEPVSCQISI